MKKLIFTIVIALLLSACSSEKNEYLIKFYVGNMENGSAACGYLNAKGDTIIPPGKYAYCFTDTIRGVGMVIENNSGKILGIDENGNELFEVFKYDNGPDYAESGLFRILKNEKIGYADQRGVVIIEPQFKCAYPFNGDFAKVAYDCERIQTGEYSSWESDHWFEITKNGDRVK
jgi:myo-inositol-hexaphosphate 3-phosphohydrolase